MDNFQIPVRTGMAFINVIKHRPVRTSQQTKKTIFAPELKEEENETERIQIQTSSQLRNRKN